MHLSGRKKALFCVASPQFEKKRAVKIVQLLYNHQYISAVMKKAEKFWETAIGKIHSRIMELCFSYNLLSVYLETRE
jgi:hypothetical protein